MKIKCKQCELETEITEMVFGLCPDCRKAKERLEIIESDNYALNALKFKNWLELIK